MERKEIFSYSITGFVALSIVAGIMLCCGLSWASFGCLFILAFVYLVALYMLYDFYRDKKNVS
jgi:apolipoprotein N-acyltransferase